LPVFSAEVTESGLMSHLTRNISFWGRLFTGYTVQPTVSEHWNTKWSTYKGPVSARLGNVVLCIGSVKNRNQRLSKSTLHFGDKKKHGKN